MTEPTTDAPKRPRFDNVYTFGHLLQAVVIVGSLMASVYTFSGWQAKTDASISRLAEAQAEDKKARADMANAFITIREDLATIKAQMRALMRGDTRG